MLKSCRAAAVKCLDKPLESQDSTSLFVATGFPTVSTFQTEPSLLPLTQLSSVYS